MSVAVLSNSRLPNHRLLPLLRRAATAAREPPSRRPQPFLHRGPVLPPRTEGPASPLPRRPRTRPASPHDGTGPATPRLADRNHFRAAGAGPAVRGGRSRPNPLPSRVPALPAVLTGVVVGRRRPRTTGPREQRAGSVRWRPTWLPRARSPPPCGAAEGFRGGGGPGPGPIMQKIKSLMTRQVSGSGAPCSPRGRRAWAHGLGDAGVCGRARAP